MEAHVKERYGNVKCVDGASLEFEFVVQELNKIPAQFELNPERVKPWGTAHVVFMARDVIKEPFLVINGDDFYGKESFKIAGEWLRAHENTKGQSSLIGFQLENTLTECGGVSRGICTADAAGMLTHVEEHSKIAKPEDGHIYGDNYSGEHVELNGKDRDCKLNCVK